MAGDHDFALNPTPTASLHLIGREREPVMVLDGIMRRPEALVDYAASAVSFAPAGTPQGGYPGVRAPAPLNYVESLVKAMDPIVRRAFGLGQVGLARAECNFSMVTTAPEELTATQRVPHVDTYDALQFAFLHYLCGARFGGTAFYRQRSTGFEAITPQRGAAYVAARDGAAAGVPPDYIRGDSRDYEQIAAFEARFDRLLIYRSRLLHSGQIPPDMPRIADPRAGRLTANIFVGYARR
ncbi:MAG TPA: DUF6445 family protein [Allosphingosinicella sp.]